MKRYKIIIISLVVIVILMLGYTSFFLQKKEVTIDGNEKNILNIVSVVSLNKTYIVLDDNGNIWQWNEEESQEDAELVADLKNIIKIMNAGSAVYALTQEGDVYAWGRNERLMIAPKESRDMEYEKPIKLDALSNIVDMDAGNGKAFAVDSLGKVYVWGLDRYSFEEENMYPESLEEGQGVGGGIKSIFVGAGNFHYFVGQDGNVFSIMDVEYTADHLGQYIFPCFSDDEPVVYWWENTNIFDMRKGSKTGMPVLYEMGENQGISFIAADEYTMYLYREDNTLWYWDSDRITYHDNESAGALIETAYLDYRGNFEQVNIREILGMGEEGEETPQIISICPGKENVLFLLDNGQVFMSGYITKEVRDVEYYDAGNTNPYRTSDTCIYNQMHLKELDFWKLDFEDIVSISSDKDEHFYLADKKGKIWEPDIISATRVYEDYSQFPFESKAIFLDEYNNLILEEDVKRAALIYLDEDDIPELLVLKNGEYYLYSFDGLQITTIDMPDAGVKANAYGPKHDLEDSENLIFYWFEYVPYQGLIRVHGGDDMERHDYYLEYKDGSFVLELETKSIDYTWYTYDAEREIDNEEFLRKLSDLGYDKLIPCSYLYENAADAYENIDKTSNSREVLNEFVRGNIDALYYVEEVNDTPEEGFVMRSYEDIYEDITAGEGDDWGRIEYVDFDNDGEEELIIHGYAGACVFFDAIGDTVYEVIETHHTTNVAFVAEIEGKRIIARTDLTHGGRKLYRIMQYDACGCLVDWFRLYASYEGETYCAEDVFEYREQGITMEEFEEMVNRIQRIPSE